MWSGCYRFGAMADPLFGRISPAKREFSGAASKHVSDLHVDSVTETNTALRESSTTAAAIQPQHTGENMSLQDLDVTETVTSAACGSTAGAQEQPVVQGSIETNNCGVLAS